MRLSMTTTFQQKLQFALQRWWPVAVIAMLTTGILYQRWQFTHPFRPILLKSGDHLAAVSVRNVSGNIVPLSWATDRRATLIYVFRPDCIWCKRNYDAFSAVVDAARDVRIIGISTASEGLREYIAKKQIRYPVYIATPKSEAGKQFRMRGTPETILISTDGTVQKVWFGAYVGTTARQVEQIFNLKLPEVHAE